MDAEPDRTLDALAEALRPWTTSVVGTVGSARATFRLSVVETENEEICGLVAGWSSYCCKVDEDQPAGPRAGMERRRRGAAPLAGPAAGAAADRTGPGLSDFPELVPALRGTACPSA